VQTREITVTNPLGLHARLAAKIVVLASRFKSSVLLKANGRVAEARSIIAVMVLAVGVDSTIRIEATGADETEAVNALSALINDKQLL
jgi:phosphocarrier protein HPr